MTTDRQKKEALSTSGVGKLLDKVLLSDSDLRRFLLDGLGVGIYRRFEGIKDRTDLVTKLLALYSEDLSTLVDALEAVQPLEVAKYRHLLDVKVTSFDLVPKMEQSPSTVSEKWKLIIYIFIFFSFFISASMGLYVIFKQEIDSKHQNISIASLCNNSTQFEPMDASILESIDSKIPDSAEQFIRKIFKIGPHNILYLYGKSKDVHEDEIFHHVLAILRANREHIAYVKLRDDQMNVLHMDKSQNNRTFATFFDILRSRISSGESPILFLQGGKIDFTAQSAQGSRQIPIRVKAFYLDRTEVTVAQYQACVHNGACSEPSNLTNPINCNWKQPDRMYHPINCVDAKDASAYCGWVGKRLPSEIEWEYAAGNRGHEKKYPWEDDYPSSPGSICSDQAKTCVVASHTRDQSPEGVRDLAGNVSEWVVDSFANELVKTHSKESMHVIRGGSWSRDFSAVRHRLRVADNSLYPKDAIGFRCAVNP